MNTPAAEVPVRVPLVGPVTTAAVRVSPVGVGVVGQHPGAAMVSAASSAVV